MHRTQQHMVNNWVHELNRLPSLTELMPAQTSTDFIQDITGHVPKCVTYSLSKDTAKYIRHKMQNTAEAYLSEKYTFLKKKKKTINTYI